MSILKNILLAAVLAVVAWFLYSQFAGPDKIAPPAEEAPLPFTYEVTTTTYHIGVELPATGNAALDESVRKHAEARIAEFDQMYGPAAFSPEDFEMLGFKDRGMHYELLMSGDVWEAVSPATTPEDWWMYGMIVQEYTFTGGAHGGVSLAPFAVLVTPFRFDNTKDLHLNDLFIEGSPYLDRIAEAVRPRLRADLEANGIFNESMFDAGTKADEGNYMVFSLDDSSITFHFNQYQVAAYVAGIREVTIPLSEFSDILLPDYLPDYRVTPTTPQS